MRDSDPAARIEYLLDNPWRSTSAQRSPTTRSPPSSAKAVWARCPSRIPNSLAEYRAKAMLRAADRVPYAVACMEAVVLTLLHLAVTAAKLCRPGGVRAVIAENLLLKQQLIVLRRPPSLRISVPLSRAGAAPKGRHWRPPLDTAGVSSGAGPSEVPALVLVEPSPEDARTKGAERRAHPGGR